MSSGRTNEKLWEEAKKEAIEKMGGKWSARAAQLAGKIYLQKGGRYTGKKTDAQRSLSEWSSQNWRTKSGLPSSITGERYLPEKVIASLSDKDYKITSKAKKEGMKKGIQFVPQPKKIIEKIKKIKKK
jgi:hypothetical protein